MKKYILLFAVLLLAEQSQAQGWGGWNRLWKHSGHTTSPARTIDTTQVFQMRFGTSTTAGFVPVADARGIMTLQTVGASSVDLTANYNWTGTHTYDDFVKKADVLEFLGGGLTGGTDTTAYDVPSKLVAAGDSLRLDLSLSKRFTSLDSVVVYATTTSTSGDSMAVSVEFKKIAEGGSVSAAYNAAQVDTLDMGSGATLTVFRFTSFGSLATGAGELVGKVRRKSLAANDMTASGIIRRVILYGVGLR